MFNKITTLISLTLFLSNAHADELNTNFKKPTFDFAISGFSIKEDALLARGSSSIFYGHFGYKIDENLNFKIDPVASFISGQQTSRDPQIPLTNSIYLEEATIEYQATRSLLVSAGSIYQKDFLPGLAGYTKSFPGIGLKSNLEIKENHQINFLAQIAVPTSSGLATTTNDLESNTSLFSSTLILKNKWNDHLKTKFSYSHFIFNGLSSATSADSFPKGNTLIKLNSSSYIYAYKYSGDEIMTKMDFDLNSKMGISLESSLIKNQLAPSDTNTGFITFIGIPVNIADSIKLTPMFYHYRVESDAMVATFLDTNFGRTNRIGNRIGFEIEKNNYHILCLYSESKLIETNPFQSPDRSILLKIFQKNIAF